MPLPDDRLLQVVYVSAAVRLFTPEALVELLRVSRANNARRDITGLLLYQGGNFIQVLEGPAGAVEDVHARIAHDPRHRQMITLLKGPVERREFGDWSMGFRHVDALDASDRAAFSPFLTGPGSPARLDGDPGRAMKLLRSFRDTMR